jgi:protocatechuate 4,5-dioxygenase alpha chain
MRQLAGLAAAESGAIYRRDRKVRAAGPDGDACRGPPSGGAALPGDAEAPRRIVLAMSQKHDYDDIPGTVIFDAQRARRGYFLNQFLMSLMKPENRKEFLADEKTYLKKYPLTPAQEAGVLKRDWNMLLELGGVSYALAKLAFTDGHSYQFMAAEMTGLTQQQYADMMLAGGRSPDGWRSKAERGEA